MPAIEDSIDIRAPIGDVFVALTDPRRSLEWNTNIVEVREVADGPVRLGTSWHQVAVVAGRRVNLVCRVVQWEPPHAGVLEISGDQQGKLHISCLQVDGVTVVHQTLEFTPPRGIFGQMAAGMLQPMFKREMAQTLTRQRDVLEREHRDKRGVGTG